jgi:hypothetical protein
MYLFIERSHGKSALAKATEIEAKSSGFSVRCLDGMIGATQKELRDLQPRADALTIVDGLPESAPNRQTVLERFNSLAGKGLLLARPEYCADANLDSGVPMLRLDHVDQRPIDKIAWLIGLVRERLRDGGLNSEAISSALIRLPAKGLMALSKVKLGPKISELANLASHIAESLQVQPDEALTQEVLTEIFLEFFSPPSEAKVEGFRLWVEGETDCRALRLVARLANGAHGIDMEEGLAIVPLGEGRQGGPAKHWKLFSHIGQEKTGTFSC